MLGWGTSFGLEMYELGDGFERRRLPMLTLLGLNLLIFKAFSLGQGRERGSESRKQKTLKKINH